MMTKQQAKDLTIKVWEALAADGRIEHKHDLPKKLYAKIQTLKCKCPLCVLFNTDEEDDWFRGCSGCPLKEAEHQCHFGKNFYSIWSNLTSSTEERAKAAQGIVDIVQAWDIKE
jgi:hypothetical protein